MPISPAKVLRSSRAKQVLALVILILLGVVIWRSLSSNTQPQGRKPFALQGQVMVHAAKSRQAEVPVYLLAPGTVKPSASVTVTSRIDGQLEKLFFTEGQWVAAGTLLAKIDDRSYQASLRQYQGALAEHKALLKNAELTLARYRKLYAQDSLARQDLESQVALVGQYKGTIAQDEAQIAQAKVNISYAQITAPIAGRVGLRQVDPGNMVHSSDTNGIVTITLMQPAEVSLSVPQNNIPDLLAGLKQKALPASLLSDDTHSVLAEGEVRYLSNVIDTTTGTVAMKAVFANHNESLFTNQFVNVRLQLKILHQAVVVPAQAIQLSSEGSFVYTVDAANKVHRKLVTTGPLFSTDMQVVTTGVKPDELLVTEGIDRLSEGSEVKVVANESSNSTKVATDNNPNKSDVSRS